MKPGKVREKLYWIWDAYHMAIHEETDLIIHCDGVFNIATSAIEEIESHKSKIVISTSETLLSLYRTYLGFECLIRNKERE